MTQSDRFQERSDPFSRDAERSAPPFDMTQRVITVRLPAWKLDALHARAHLERTSLNQLCVKKLDELLPQSPDERSSACSTPDP